jgi:hypothetical protein
MVPYVSGYIAKALRRSIYLVLGQCNDKMLKVQIFDQSGHTGYNSLPSAVEANPPTATQMYSPQSRQCLEVCRN